jgi:hypothetical protein
MVLTEVHKFGQKRDSAKRNHCARKDNLSHQAIISSAQKAIYEGNYGVTSAAVERIIGEYSWSAAAVCLFFY